MDHPTTDHPTTAPPTAALHTVVMVPPLAWAQVLRLEACTQEAIAVVMDIGSIGSTPRAEVVVVDRAAAAVAVILIKQKLRAGLVGVL